MLSFYNISCKSKTFELLLSRSEGRQQIRRLTVEDIDQLLSEDFKDELRIVRRMLTGDIKREPVEITPHVSLTRDGSIESS